MGRRITSGIIFLLASFMPLGYASDKGAGQEEQLDVHRSVACTNCHQLLASNAAGAELPANDTTCQTCHDQGQTNPADWSSIFHEDPNRPCTDCHSFHNPEIIKTGDKEFIVSDRELTSFLCQTCHISGQPIELVSEGHRRAATDFYHSDNWSETGESPSQTCLNCHSEHGLSGSGGLGAAIGINVSASHSIGIDINTLARDKRRSKIDQKIRLFENNIECQSCHTLSSAAKDALVEYNNPYDLCYGCHAIRG